MSDITFTLDRNTPIPLHYQLQQQLRAAILDGRLDAANPLPPEPELAAQTGVSRSVVRQAIAELVHDGLLRRQRGRGTFISEPAATGAGSHVASYVEEIKPHRLGAPSAVVSSAAISAPDDVREAFRPNVSDTVVEIVRVRAQDGTPDAVEKIYLRADRFGRLVDRASSLERLYDVLEREYGVVVTRAEETLRAVVLPSDVAKLLKVSASSPGFLLVRRTFAGEEVVEVRYSYLAGGRLQFSRSLANARKIDE